MLIKMETAEVVDVVMEDEDITLEAVADEAVALAADVVADVDTEADMEAVVIRIIIVIPETTRTIGKSMPRTVPTPPHQMPLQVHPRRIRIKVRMEIKHQPQAPEETKTDPGMDNTNNESTETIY